MLKKLKDEKEKKRDMVVRNVKKVQSARPKSAVKMFAKPPGGRGGNINNLNRDLAINDNEEDAEAWFKIEEAGEGDQGANMPPREVASPVRQVRETIQDRIGRK